MVIGRCYLTCVFEDVRNRTTKTGNESDARLTYYPPRDRLDLSTNWIHPDPQKQNKKVACYNTMNPISMVVSAHSHIQGPAYCQKNIATHHRVGARAVVNIPRLLLHLPAAQPIRKILTDMSAMRCAITTISPPWHLNTR